MLGGVPNKGTTGTLFFESSCFSFGFYALVQFLGLGSQPKMR